MCVVNCLSFCLLLLFHPYLAYPLTFLFSFLLPPFLPPSLPPYLPPSLPPSLSYHPYSFQFPKSFCVCQYGHHCAGGPNKDLPK